MANIEETINEVCPYCGEEVELPFILGVHKCPNCGKHIVACNACTAIDEVEGCCKACCLDYLARQMNGEID